MDKYKVEDLHEGMIVGESVFDENNKLLIAAGFSLENKHIAAFKKKGISTVFINEILCLKKEITRTQRHPIDI